MRVRTEERRQEIIQTAARLFEELGYERTSTDGTDPVLGAILAA